MTIDNFSTKHEGDICYSIIIPHKNVPKLLRRCLNSIPKRNDIQIIIIDDNSEPSIVNFNDFPGMGEPYTEVFFTKENRGAGYARNIGLTKAKGKWLVFADADDYFNESFDQLMDKYEKSSADLIFFKSNSVDSDSLKPVKSRGEIYNQWYIESIRNGYTLDKVRYRIHPPWSKFFSRKLIISNEIKFDETFTANDAMFSVRSGHIAEEIIIDTDYLYCSTVRANSLANRNDIKHFKPRFEVTLNLYKYLRSIKKVKHRPNIWILIAFLRKKDKGWIQNFVKPTFLTMNLKHFLTDFFKLIILKISLKNEE